MDDPMAKPRWVCNAESYEVGLGYAVLANGDIVTSGGQPVDVDEWKLRFVAEQAAKDGRKIEFKFRAPTEEESKNNFKEKQNE